MQELFQFTMAFDVLLIVQYIATKDNPADAPSRNPQPQDAMLTPHIWNRVQLDSNVMRHPDDMPLRHFSPVQMPNAEAVNVFVQTWTSLDKAYAFPPMVMTALLFRYIHQYKLTLTIILIKSDPCPPPLVAKYSCKSEENFAFVQEI